MFTAAPAAAQEPPALEVGGQVTILRLGEFDATDAGAGVNVAWRLPRWLALEGVLSWFPSSGDDSPRVSRQQKLLALVGARGSYARGRLEILGRVRPGVLRFSSGEPVACILIFPVPLECKVLGGYTAFAAEAGGGVRVGLDRSERLHLSIDVSDLMVRFSGQSIRPNREVTDGFVTHNLMVGAGLGWRF